MYSVQEEPAPDSGYKIERCPYDMDSDKDEDDDTAGPQVPALLQQLRRLSVFKTYKKPVTW